MLRELNKIHTSIGANSTRFHDLCYTYAVSSLRAGDDIKTFTMKRESSQRMEVFISALK